jgi:hypothetical protein
MGAGKRELVAQKIAKQQTRFDLALIGLAVDCDRDGAEFS